MSRLFTMMGAGFMFLAVGAGAFGAHALRSYFGRFPNLEATYETAVRYHMIHALALLAVAWAADKWGGALTQSAGVLFILGILLFSGSLYLLVFTRVSWLGVITPFGGLAFLAGWVSLLLAAWRS
ncbi:MAG: DUF423 domain-containing protein [Anaerolineae bacterium]